MMFLSLLGMLTGILFSIVLMFLFTLKMNGIGRVSSISFGSLQKP